MTRERAAELLNEVMVLDEPEMVEAHRVAISALRQQEHFREVTKKVEPLTLSELRKMGGEAVWCKELECYGIIKIETIGRFANTPFLIGVYHDFDLGTAVNFEYDIKRRHFSLYRQKPEEDDRDERKENENA